MNSYYVILQTLDGKLVQYSVRQLASEAKSTARKYRSDSRWPGAKTTIYRITHKKQISYTAFCWIIADVMYKQMLGTYPAIGVRAHRDYSYYAGSANRIASIR